ncbi:MAG: hypothetical protein EOO95_15265 [Pedobacter sp.]|nr:MAG: hypothetical protein EOO95_15265 [Pedobacter sp.]
MFTPVWVRNITELTTFNFDLVTSFYNTKAILRPMSDLTRSMLEEAGFNSHIDYLTHELQNEANSGRLDSNGKKLWRVEHAPYEMVAYLFREHFDVFGLIEKGLAISIHDVKTN